MSKKPLKQPQRVVHPKQAASSQRKRQPLPVLPIFFVLTWLWAAWYYGSVFHISREYSFWVPDTRIMEFILSQSYGILRYIGRAMLQLYRFPWLGGLFMALMLTAGSWLTGYCMRLRPSWRSLQYLPALFYIAVVTWHGLDIFFEARTGLIFGIPFAALVVLCIWGMMIKSFSRKPAPTLIGIPMDETPRQNGIQFAVIAICLAAIIGFDMW